MKSYEAPSCSLLILELQLGDEMIGQTQDPTQPLNGFVFNGNAPPPSTSEVAKVFTFPTEEKVGYLCKIFCAERKSTDLIHKSE